MKLEIDAARLLVWRAAWMWRRYARRAVGYRNGEGSMAKLKAGQVAVRHRARDPDPRRQRHTREYPVERMHRDAKIYDIFEGTAEIQQLVIGGRSRRPHRGSKR